MRYSEFKPTLLEFAPPTGKGANDLQLLSNIIEIVDPDEPIYNVAMGIIKRLVKNQQPAQQVQQPTTTQVAPQAQAPVQPSEPAALPEPEEEPALGESLEPGDEPWYTSFLDLISDPAVRQKMLSNLRSDPTLRDAMKLVHRGHQKAVKQSYTQGSTEALVTVDQFFKEVKKSADLLAAKAVGILSEMRQWYENEAKRSDETDENNTRPKPTQTALYQKLLYPLENIFQDLGFRDTPPNLRSFKQEYPKILKFMHTCEDGIIDFQELLTGSGNVGDLIQDPELKYVYDKIFDKLLALDAGQGGGAWGPGELGLAILCRPVSKAKNKGDLTTTIDGEEVGVEVKASRNAKSGGRLGGKGVTAGDNGQVAFKRALVELCKKANYPISNVGKNFAEVVKYKTVKGVKTKVGTGVMKESGSVKPTNMASSNWFDWFNREIPERLTKNRVMAKEAVGDFLLSVISGVVTEAGKPFIKENLIRSIPNPDGTIDYEKFKKILTRQWYEIYKNTDGVGLILVINPTNGNYTVVNSGAMLTSKKSNVVITGGLDFSDSQGKAGPQIGIE